MPKKIESNLEGVAYLLNCKRPAGVGNYCLYAAKNKIKITEGRIPLPGGELIVPLVARDINLGPPTRLWNAIDARIRNLKEKGIL